MDAKRTGELINRIRNEKGYTQSALAQQLNISNRTVSKWENGDGFPDISMLPELAQLLGISVDELLAGERFEQMEVEHQQAVSVPYPVFKSRSPYNKRSVVRLYRYINSRYFPLWLRIIMSVMLCAAGITIVKTDIITGHTDGDILPLFMPVFLAILIFALIFSDYFSAFIQRMQTKAKNGGVLPDSEFELSDALRIKNGAEQYTYPLSAVTAFEEFSGYFIIRINKKLYMLVGKDNFVEGTPEEMSAYLRSFSAPPKKSGIMKVIHIVLSVNFILITALMCLMISAPSAPMMTSEEIVGADNDKLFESFYEEFYPEASEQDGIGLTFDMNEQERRAVLVCDFYDEFENGGLCQYLCNSSGHYAYELENNLKVLGMEELAEEFASVVKENKLDLERYKASADYDEELKKYDFESMDDRLNKAIKNADVPRHIAKYIKDNPEAFAQDFQS